MHELETDPSLDMCHKIFILILFTCNHERAFVNPQDNCDMIFFLQTETVMCCNLEEHVWRDAGH